MNPKRQPHATFKFKGSPRVEMTFGLFVVGGGGAAIIDPSFPDVDWRVAILAVTIEKEPGQVVASAQGPISAWETARSSDWTMLWDSRLRDVPFDTKSAYEISIKVSGLGPAARNLSLVPILKGGGIELP